MQISTYAQNAYAEATRGIDAKGHVNLTHHRFGDPRLKGNQRKAMVYFEDDAPRFFKLDETKDGLPPFKPEFDFQYASISEALASCVVASMQPDPQFECVQYRFESCVDNQRIITASSSANYLSGNSLESILANNERFDEVYEDYRVGMQEFASEIADGTNNQQILDQLLAYANRYGVEPALAKHFYVQQAGFDLLLANADRKQNMGNFIFRATFDGQVTPINFDYGRCLPMTWTSTTNAAFIENKLSLGDSEIESDYVDELIATGGGIMNNHHQRAQNIADLHANGYVPLKIDLTSLQANLDACCHRIEHFHSELYPFARTKADVMFKALADPRNEGLWEEG